MITLPWGSVRVRVVLVFPRRAQQDSVIIIYYRIAHVVRNNEKYRRHSKIKGNMQIHNLYQLAAKKLIISHNSYFDKRDELCDIINFGDID